MTGMHTWVGKALLALLICMVLYYARLYTISAGSTLVFFDVGQGDATLVMVEDVVVLIDGGPDSSFVHELHRYLDAGIKIDYLVLTHFHQDHILGLFEVAKRYEVGTAILPTSCINNDMYWEFVDMITASSVVFTNYVDFKFVGDHLEVEYGDDVSKCFVSQKDVNNSSVVVLVSYEESIVALMGDAETAREDLLLASGLLPPDISILKAGHHCSDSSSQFKLLSYLSPSLVVCSYGKDNMYGHPGSQVLDYLRYLNIDHMDTANEGDIIINL